MTFGLSMVALAIAAATATFVLIIHELHIRALNIRVSKAVMGVPGQSAPFQDMTGWLSSLGMRYRRFYSTENLDQLRTILQSSGFNHHRIMPILIGVKTVSMFVFPIIALFVAEFLGKSPRDLDRSAAARVVRSLAGQGFDAAAVSARLRRAAKGDRRDAEPGEGDE